MFFKRTYHGIVILILYVDDIVIIGTDHKGLETLIHYFSIGSHTQDLRKRHYFLGIEIAKSKKGICLS